MTASRVRNCQRICNNSNREGEQLSGFVSVIEDWHAKQYFLGVCNCWFKLNILVNFL